MHTLHHKISTVSKIKLLCKKYLGSEEFVYCWQG